MNSENAFFSMKLEGPDIKPGRVRLEDLIRLGQEMLRAVERVALVLQGTADSQHPGRRPQDIRAAISLDVVEITHGSPSAVIRFERSDTQISIPDADLGQQAFEKFLYGLSAVTAEDGYYPPGYDAGVLLAVRDLGRVFDRGVDCIEFSMHRPAKPVNVLYNREGYVRVQKRIVGPHMNKRSIEGRLLMADFKERGSRLRVHPSSGDPVICLFDESLRDEIYRNILHFVRVTGEAKEDPVSNRIVSISVSDIERIESKEDQATEFLPSGAPLPGDFWHAMSFDELATAQGVKPINDIDSVIGTWPGDVNDGFEEAVHRRRHAETGVS